MFCIWTFTSALLQYIYSSIFTFSLFFKHLPPHNSVIHCWYSPCPDFQLSGWRSPTAFYLLACCCTHTISHTTTFFVLSSVISYIWKVFFNFFVTSSICLTCSKARFLQYGNTYCKLLLSSHWTKTSLSLPYYNKVYYGHILLTDSNKFSLPTVLNKLIWLSFQITQGIYFQWIQQILAS